MDAPVPVHTRASPPLIAVLGPTATGKSALGIALARRYGGEIVNCDSTAVYRGFDIGTDKIPVEAQEGIAHHLVDLVDPTDAYSAAHFARDAAARIRDITARGRVPVLVGGTGFYFRALTVGLFDGPGRDEALRERIRQVAARRGVEFLHRLVARADPYSGRRIMPRDEKRLVRALEVRILTGRPLSAHFADTRSPLPEYRVLSLGLTLPSEVIGQRVARRVDEQWRRGIVQEVEDLLDAGVPRHAHPFSGLVYRQILEMLDGVRDEDATRALIVRENRQYARRQLIWFRKDPTLLWLEGAGDWPATLASACRVLESSGVVDA